MRLPPKLRPVTAALRRRARRCHIALAAMVVWGASGCGGGEPLGGGNTPPTVVVQSPPSGATLQLLVDTAIVADARDGDGRVTLVEFLDGGTLLGSVTAPPYRLPWAPAAPGVHQLTARATDNDGARTTSAGVTVSVNAPPTVSLTAPAAGAHLPKGVPVALTAAAADADGSVSQVRFLDGASVVGTVSTAPFTLDWTPATEGGHTLTAEATDNDGGVTVSAPVTVTVTQTGAPTVTILQPPAGTTYQAGDTIAYAGTAVDGSGAPLPGTALTWWVDLHHDTHTHPFLPPTPGAGGSVVVPIIGETSANVWLRFYLRAADAQGVADTVYREIFPRTVTLTVTSVPAGRTVTLDGQPRTTPYSVAAVVGLQRELGAPSPQSSTDSAYQFQQWSDGGAATHTILTPAVSTTYTAAFQATGAANQPPTVAVTAPAAGASVVVNTAVSVTAGANDPDGTVQQVDFFDGTTLIGSDNTAPYGVSWTPTVLGGHSLTARATDDGGATTTSAAVAVTVVSGGGGDTQAPVATLTAPSDGDQGLSGSVTAAATASDNVGVVAVEFQLDGATLGVDSSPPYQATLPGTGVLTAGVHVFRARAQDAAGNLSAWSYARVITDGGNLPAGFTRTSLISGLGGIGTAMGFAPDGRLFICEQDGDLRVVKNGVLLAQPFVHVPTMVDGERGLLGVTFHPDFAANHYVYVYYTTATPNNRISRFTAAGDTAVTGSEVVIADLPALSANYHNGGAIHFGLDGKLYVAVGDNGTSGNSQSLATRLGKVLRYNDDGTIPGDNPLLGSTVGVNQAIWAMGLRNPFTFAVQPGTGRLLINDVGETTWEEINQGIAGANYGWPATEGPTSDPRFTSPLYAYRHGGSPDLLYGGAIVGAAFYNPASVTFPPEYVGTYFFGDYVEHWIYRLNLPGGDPTPYAFAQLPEGALTDLAVGPDGSLYALAVQANGTWGVWRFSH